MSNHDYIRPCYKCMIPFSWRDHYATCPNCGSRQESNNDSLVYTPENQLIDAVRIFLNADMAYIRRSTTPRLMAKNKALKNLHEMMNKYESYQKNVA